MPNQSLPKKKAHHFYHCIFPPSLSGPQLSHLQFPQRYLFLWPWVPIRDLPPTSTMEHNLPMNRTLGRVPTRSPPSSVTP
ncbi:hypothetical protein CIPAW_05G071400 [Carya illinoinensis]|uniref:Uncharacterized protein n=1 Tax=Carya illinoinensis TaxID=32201 RepID=A0A8T1QFQ9_CARIL|nr:hypothetical protein CIPAW_05G071400 [Carya illinoinensis]